MKQRMNDMSRSVLADTETKAVASRLWPQAPRSCGQTSELVSCNVKKTNHNLNISWNILRNHIPNNHAEVLMQHHTCKVLMQHLTYKMLSYCSCLCLSCPVLLACSMFFMVLVQHQKENKTCKQNNSKSTRFRSKTSLSTVYVCSVASLVAQ